MSCSPVMSHCGRDLPWRWLRVGKSLGSHWPCSEWTQRCKGRETPSCWWSLSEVPLQNTVKYQASIDNYLLFRSYYNQYSSVKCAQPQRLNIYSCLQITRDNAHPVLMNHPVHAQKLSSQLRYYMVPFMLRMFYSQYPLAVQLLHTQAGNGLCWYPIYEVTIVTSLFCAGIDVVLHAVCWSRED